MGAGQSKDELLYQEVQNGNYDAVKALRRSGASLEWVDKEGRTPLILACTRGELLDMAQTLLNLGANIDVYRPGTHRGTPLHHAAKRGLEKTVVMLLSRGANPMVINDAGLTPLQMARSRGHLSVVRILEEHLCLFSGMVREISGFGILETIAPSLVTKKVWAVVVPLYLSPRRVPMYELAVYESIKVPQPRTVVSLAKAEIEEPKFNMPDPVLYITDKTTKTKYKFLSEQGDKAQLERLYRACNGLHQVGVGSPNVGGNMPLNGPAQVNQATLISSESASRPVNRMGESSNEPPPSDNHHGWDNTQEESHNGWGRSHGGNQPKKQGSEPPTYGGWEGKQSTFNGWGPTEAGGPSTSQSSPTAGPPSVVQPSAPPLPEGPFEYPSLDMDGNPPAPPTTQVVNTPSEKSGGMCVICWDAPTEGACVPCGHLSGCMSCLSEVKAKNWGCPVCRLPIQQIVKVYAV